MKNFSRLFPVVAIVAIGILVSLLFSPTTQNAFGKKLSSIPFRYFRHACDNSPRGFARCHAQVVTDSKGIPHALTTPPFGSYGPVQFHSAYALPCTPGGIVQSQCPTLGAFGPQTIAIVDAYNDPSVENDLLTYSSAYGIAPCSRANGCLSVVNEAGTGSLPQTNNSWALEIALDTQIAHTVCQTCKILLVEASTSSISDLGTAENTAARLGATVISNSYGASEWVGETGFDAEYTHPGVAVTASSGDSGYGTEYPAASPSVVSVGGTTLQLFTDNSYGSETVWSGSGSGCSLFEQANVWQTNLPNWGATGCITRRGIVDIAADADPNTGAGVYDSTPYQGSTGWWIVGGTSLASPIVASEYALWGVLPHANAGEVLYQNYSQSPFHDVTTGSNGFCATIMCQAGIGYDGPSGLGSLSGLGALLFTLPSPTPTSTPSPTLTPSITPTPTATPTPTGMPTPTPTQAPESLVVSITTPSNNAFVRRGSSVLVSASVTDTLSVSKVEFFINGSLTKTISVSPYQFFWHVPTTRNKKYTLTAKAFDVSGNIASSSITVTAQ